MAEGPKILVLDIETSPMQAWTFSLFKAFIAMNQIIQHTRVISWAAKWHGDDQPIMFMSEYHHGREAMLARIHALLCEADIVVHFNGDTFDVPHLRRELDQAGFSPWSPFQTFDLYKIAKRQMYFPTYKLDYVASQLTGGHKLHNSGFQLWIDCLTPPPADDPNKQKRAWALMRRYNKQDVAVTDDLYLKIRVYGNHPHVGLFADDPGIDCCSVCGSTDLVLEGFSYTSLGKYQRYHCGDCGKWSRSKKAVATVGARGVAS